MCSYFIPLCDLSPGTRYPCPHWDFYTALLIRLDLCLNSPLHYEKNVLGQSHQLIWISITTLQLNICFFICFSHGLLTEVPIYKILILSFLLQFNMNQLWQVNSYIAITKLHFHIWFIYDPACTIKF